MFGLANLLAFIVTRGNDNPNITDDANLLTVTFTGGSVAAVYARLVQIHNQTTFLTRDIIDSQAMNEQQDDLKTAFHADHSSLPHLSLAT